MTMTRYQFRVPISDVFRPFGPLLGVVIGFGTLAYAIHAAPVDESVTLRMSPRAAHGLLRALRAGVPMAGPEVDAVAASLADALGAAAPLDPRAPRAPQGEPAAIEAY